VSVVKVLSGFATAIVIFIALGIDYFTGTEWAFSALIFAVLVGGLLEFYRMSRERTSQPLQTIGITLGILYLVFVFVGQRDPAFPGPDMLLSLVLTLGVMATLINFLIKPKQEHAFESSMATIFGLTYVILLGGYLFMIRFQAFEWAFLFVCTAKSCDIGAYLIGSSIGKHSFHPESPRKTIEGSIAGIAVGTGIALLVTALFLAPDFPYHLAVIYGVIICITSQVGDLAESLIKRRCGVKDSASLIPGSGGMLDFVDCLLFSAPVAYFFIKFTVK
jgi:phosphatidate cytidylyltransferase